MTAELLIKNCVIFDGFNYRPEVSAMAVASGKVMDLGENLDHLVDEQTKVVDAAGGLVMPGFIDAHVHPIEGGLEHSRCDLAGINTLEGLLEAIEAYANANPNLEWIIGGGWQIATFPSGTPMAADLDRIVPDRPVYLPNRDHHGTWVNSTALRLAGISADTPDPVDGRIERDGRGNPTGTLHEGATNLVKRFIPKDTFDEKYSALLVGQRLLHSVGVTGWQDAIVGNYGGHSDTREVYQSALDNGDLKSNVVAALWWERDRGLEQLGELRAKRLEHQAAGFKATSIKLMLDGIPENHTAALGEPYRSEGCGCAGDHRGILFIDSNELNDIVAALDADCWQVHVHAIGDRAVTRALDAFEFALAVNGTTDNRHHIAHVQMVRPEDVVRFAKIGVTATIQALWATNDPQMVNLNLPALGSERVSWQYPFGDLARAGAQLAAGSDWPVTSPNPWKAIHAAVNRTLWEGDADYNEKPLNIEQALTLEQMLAAYTSGSARINHQEDVGVLKPGFRADFVITNRDPFTASSMKIVDTLSVATYVGGVEMKVNPNAF